MKQNEIAQSILEEEVSHSIMLYRRGLYLVTAFLWVVLLIMTAAEVYYGLFDPWQFFLIGGLCVYLTGLTYALIHDGKLKETLRQKLELRLRMKFHWFF